MGEQVNLEIDLSNGKVSISCPPEELDHIFDRLERLGPVLAAQRQTTSPVHFVESTINSPTEKPQLNGPAARPKAGAKNGAFSPAELGLNDDQKRELLAFYKLKSPTSQGDQYLVVMDWLKKAGKSPLSVEEVCGGLRALAVRIPKSPSGVMANLSSSSLVTSAGRGLFSIAFLGEDRVRDDLPKAASATK